MSAPPAPTAVGLEQAADEVLVDRSVDGDRRAFAVLVRRYGRLLRSYATRVAGDDRASDDVVQEAFVTAWQQLDALEDRTAVRAWLIRIATRKALDAAMGRRDHDDVDDLELAAAAHAGPDRIAEASSLSDALGRELDRLPETQRRAWVLRELGGYSYEEIAAELALPASTVRGALARARRTLITELDGWRQP